MKKLARIAALLLVGIMTLAMLTGCKGSFETNPKAEEQILEYVQNTFDDQLNGKKLTNNSSLHQEAAQILAKVTEDGKIKGSDYYHGKLTIYNGLAKAEVKIACVVLPDNNPSEDGMLQMKEFTGNVPEFLKETLNDLNRQCDMLLDFGVATRVINGKTYAAIAYVDYLRSEP